jgi:hypothetical protein
MSAFQLTRIVLYKHGIGYFERQANVHGEATLSLTFKQADVSDVLKSLTVLDLHGGHVSSVSYDSTKPLEQLLAEVALSIPDENSLTGLLPQIKGARIAVQPSGGERSEGVLLGVDGSERHTDAGIVRIVLVSLLSDLGEVRSFDLHALTRLEILDPALRRDLEYYLRTVLSAKKKDARSFTFFAQGEGERTLRLSYTVGAPVWKATYRIILGEEKRPPTIQGWAVVDNTQDEDWENVQLSLVAGLPVSFLHDLYTPRYIRRPVVEVKETTGVLPPTVEEGMALAAAPQAEMAVRAIAPGGGRGGYGGKATVGRRQVDASTLESGDEDRTSGGILMSRTALSSMAAQVRERKLGDLFEYQIEHPVTIRRNQSALVPIVQRGFEGRPVLLYNKQNRKDNPMRCVEFKNTTGLTLEGGPVTVLESGSYVGDAMLETTQPDGERLIPYAVELSVRVLDNHDSHDQQVNRVLIRRGTMTLWRVQLVKTTYSIDNRSDQEQVLYLEHVRPDSEWELFDTASPHEITETFWRFRFPLAARQVTAFVVQQRHLIQSIQTFSQLSDSQLGLWMEQRYINQQTQEKLREVLDRQHQAADAQQGIERLQEERNSIHAEQARVRENLQALGDRSSEKDLRERLVRTLNGQEDRLEQIAANLRSLTEQQKQWREEIANLMAGLEYETQL